MEKSEPGQALSIIRRNATSHASLGVSPGFETNDGITMAETYHVHLTKDSLVFSAAHFITFGDNHCERLHGHNYGVWVEVEGPLEPNQYVIDFIRLRDSMHQITFDLDHHVLLPQEHPTILVREEGDEVIATFDEKRWVFPKEDCRILPLSNTTAELLARYLAQRLLKSFQDDGIAVPAKLRVGVDENRGQWAIYEWRAADDQ